MNIIIGEWFWISQVERDVFEKLKKAGVHYNKSNGFKITSETDLDFFKNILKNALNDEIEIFLKCFICGKVVECIECVYQKNCESYKIFQLCICKTCYAKDEISNLYAIHFLNQID